MPSWPTAWALSAFTISISWLFSSSTGFYSNLIFVAFIMAMSYPTSNHGRSQLRLRLQVWHYDTMGQTFHKNKRLAQLLERINLHDWHIHLVRPRSDHASSRDIFIPIQVDLSNEHLSPDQIGTQESTLRMIFQDILPHIEEMFSHELDMLHLANMFPIGTATPDDLHKRFIHVHAWQPLGVDCHMSIKSTRTTEPDIMATLLSTLQTIPRSAAVIGDMSQMVKDLPERIAHGESLVNEQNRVQEMLAKSQILPDFQKWYGDEDVGFEVYQQQLQEAWAEVLPFLECYRLVALRMQDCAQKLSLGRGISNQSLYETLTGMNSAVTAWSDFNDKMRNLREDMMAQYDKDEKPSHVILSGVVGLIIAGAFAGAGGGAQAVLGAEFPMTALQSALGTGLAIAGISSPLGVRECWQLKKISDKKSAVKSLGDDIEKLGATLFKTRSALAAFFYARVLRTPLDLLGKQEQEALLGRLELDVDFEEPSALEREMEATDFEDFCKVYQDFQQKRKAVMGEAGLNEVPVFGPVGAKPT